MACERATEDNYRVVVKLPKTLTERCRDCWTGPRPDPGTGLGRACEPCLPCWGICYCIFLGLFSVAIISLWWILILVLYCQITPCLGLEDVSIRDMVVYQNTMTNTTWQVKSDINFNLSARNPNTVAGCFTTYRRTVVDVQYKGQRILQQEVPLGFGLKPRQSRPVLLALQGEGYPVQTDLASLLQVVLRNASAVELQFSFDTRYMRNDRKAGWMGMGCDVIAKTPATANSSQGSFAGGLVWSSCQDT